VVDELGYVPPLNVGAELIFDVISTAYERTSLIVTSNLPFESWTEVLGSSVYRGRPRSAHLPVPDPREEGRELLAPGRQGPGTNDQAGKRQLRCTVTACPTSPPGPWTKLQPPSNF
jgi:hypothetical protein